MNDMTFDTPEKIYKNAPEKIKSQLLIGICFLILSIAMLPTLGDSAPVWMGPFFIMLYFVNGKMEVVRVYSKYTEVKSAPIRGRVPILNREIEKIKVIKERIILLTVREDGVPKEYKVPINYFSEKNKKEIISYYEKQVEENEKE